MTNMIRLWPSRSLRAVTSHRLEGGHYSQSVGGHHFQLLYYILYYRSYSYYFLRSPRMYILNEVISDPGPGGIRSQKNILRSPLTLWPD